MNFAGNDNRTRAHAFRTFRFAAFAVALALVFTLVASCAESEPQDTVSPLEVYFQVLNGENRYHSDLGTQRLQEFYAAGAPADMTAKLAASQAAFELDVTASVRAEALGSDADTSEFFVKLLRDASLRVSGQLDPEKKSGLTNIALILAGQRLASADLLTEGGKVYAARSEELYPSYIALEHPVLMKIIADAAQNDALGGLSGENITELLTRYAGLPALLSVAPEQLKTLTKPYIDKARETVTAERFAMHENYALADMPGGTYTMLSYSVSGDELRELLTALVHMAKDDAALLSLIYDKYAVLYDCVNELSELGADVDALLGVMPPPEGVESLFRSMCSAAESMLGSSAAQPFQSLNVDLYLSGTALKRVDIALGFDRDPAEVASRIAGTGMSAAEPVPATGANTANAAAAAKMSFYGQTNSGGASGTDAAPPYMLSLSAQTREDVDGWRHDSFMISSSPPPGGLDDSVTLSSVLKADEDGGTNALRLSFFGPTFRFGLPDLNFDYAWDSLRRGMEFGAQLPNDTGGIDSIIRLEAALTDAGDGGRYDVFAALGLNDPYTRGGEAAGAAEDAADTEDDAAAGSDRRAVFAANYDMSVACEGEITFGSVSIPAFETTGARLLDQESFYDGTFEAVFDEFYTNLVRFASANIQLLRVYGFPGF